VDAEHIWEAGKIKGLKYRCKLAAVMGGSAIALKGPSMTEERGD
jgi:hypothetical protein